MAAKSNKPATHEQIQTEHKKRRVKQSVTKPFGIIKRNRTVGIAGYPILLQHQIRKGARQGSRPANVACIRHAQDDSLFHRQTVLLPLLFRVQCGEVCFFLKFFIEFCCLYRRFQLMSRFLTPFLINKLIK